MNNEIEIIDYTMIIYLPKISKSSAMPLWCSVSYIKLWKITLHLLIHQLIKKYKNNLLLPIKYVVYLFSYVRSQT